MLAQIYVPGFLKGDDVEVIQAAFKSAFGFPYQPWDIRNLLVPNVLVRPFLEVARALGVTDTTQLVFVASIPFILLSALNTILLYHIAVRWTAVERIATLAAILFSLHWIPLVYGTGAFPRPAAVTCILGAVLMASSPDLSRIRSFLVGMLLALAFAVRYSEVIFALPVAWIMWQSHRRRSVALAGLGLAAGSLLFLGLYEHWTWGEAFAGVRQFFHFTILSRQSSSLEADQPAWWYLWRLPHWIAPFAWPFLLSSRHQRGARCAFLFVLVPVLVLSLIHHKELRYLQSVVPFSSLLIACGAEHLRKSWRPGIVAVLLLLTLSMQLVGTRIWLDRSSAAVMSARAVAGLNPSCAALEQSWAYGHRLYLPDTRVVDIPIAPDPAGLQKLSRDCEVVGVYSSSLTLEHYRVLREEGFQVERVFRWGRSRSVTLFIRQE